MAGVRNVCKFCNKAAENKIAKCIECESIAHRYCCEMRNVVVGVNNVTNFCISLESLDNIPAVEASSSPVEISDNPLDGDITVNQLRLEINYLTKLPAKSVRLYRTNVQ